MEAIYLFIPLLYFLAAAGLLLYGVNCYFMVGLFLRSHRKARKENTRISAQGVALWKSPEALPIITTQIPLYNEINVAERSIRAAAALDYPAKKHEIQVLDDSTDETTTIVDRVAADLRLQGKEVNVIRRKIRTGYKAGALQEGMACCRGAFLAVFDGDFLPEPDYLKKMLPFLLRNPRLAFVQARWGHLNARQSFLTRTQAIGIDGHFMIEQCARAFNGLFMNFNGTAGIWRQSAIVDSGGWQADTLTEDLDLSYRCLLAGWEAHYVPDVVVPAELPETFSAYKSQQFRWAKGSMETAKKLFPRLLRARLSWWKKVQAFFHLTHYGIHPLMLILAMLGLPFILSLTFTIPVLIGSLFLLGITIAMLGPSLLYLISQRSLYPLSWLHQVLFLPVLICVGVGIAASNTRAVLEALLGIRSSFIRTPKRGSQPLKNYRAPRNLIPFLEIGLALYCFMSFGYYLALGHYVVGPFLLMYSAGFSLMGLGSLWDELQPRWKQG